jgi:hypothetical protein
MPTLSKPSKAATSAADLEISETRRKSSYMLFLTHKPNDIILAPRKTKEKAYKTAGKSSNLTACCSCSIDKSLLTRIAWMGAAPKGSRKRAGSATLDDEQNSESPKKKSKQSMVDISNFLSTNMIKEPQQKRPAQQKPHAQPKPRAQQKSQTSAAPKQQAKGKH